MKRQEAERRAQEEIEKLNLEVNYLKTQKPVSITYIVICCKTLNICNIKFLRFSENDILAYFNFGGHDILWHQMVKKI